MTNKSIDKSNAEVLAEEIVEYLFDDYPGNNQVRRDAIAEVAKRITTAQSQLAERVLSLIAGFSQNMRKKDPTEGA